MKTYFEKRAGRDTDLGPGSYWRPARGVGVGDLRRLLKAASIGGDQESGFEQAFSSLAYAYLKDKAPRLIDFIVGFQLVDRNEDNTKAVGIFGFKVGEQWLYAPTFFLNGDLKGHELLYVKKQDSFVPMKENWVNYLISRKPHLLGEASRQDTHQLGGLMPNLQRLAYPPVGTKYGCDGASLRVDAWARPFLPYAAACAVGAARALYPDLSKQAGDLDLAAVAASPLVAALAPTAGAFDLRRFLGEDFSLLKAAYERCYLRYPAIKQGFDRFYGPGFFAEMAEAARAREVAGPDLVKSARSYVLPPKPRRRKATGGSLIPDEPAPDDPVKAGALRVVVLDRRSLSPRLAKRADEATGPNRVDEDAPTGITVNLPELDDAEREKLLRDSVLVKDERDPHAVSMAFNTQVRQDLSNPTETGLYDVLEKPGAYDEMLVLVSPSSGRGREDFAVVVRKGDPRAWLNTHPTNLWTRQGDPPLASAYREYVKGLPDAGTLAKGGTYLALHPDGGGTCPFRVRESYGDGSYRVAWEDYCQFDRQRAPGLPRVARTAEFGEPYGSNSWDCLLRVTKADGRRLRVAGGEMSLPADYRILKLADPPRRDEDDGDSLVSMCAGSGFDPASGSVERPIAPGNMADVQRLLFEKEASAEVSRLSLHDTGIAVRLEASRRPPRTLTKVAALAALVLDHGLDEATARAMLGEAAALRAHNGAASYLVKHAYGFGGPLIPGPGAPAFPAPMTGSEQVGHGSVGAIYPQEEMLPVPGMDSGRTDPSIYDPFYQPDQGAMGQAQEAAQAGQKEVFDTSMVSGMLKAVRQDSLVDRYLGDLMKALDKLGRILFMFYWHQEEFEDRYGKQELPELEDSIRNSFEGLGDVVLFLKEKTVQGGAGVELGGNNVDTDTSEPNVDEAARN